MGSPLAERKVAVLESRRFQKVGGVRKVGVRAQRGRLGLDLNGMRSKHLS